MTTTYRLGEIAERFALQLRGDPQREVRGIASLADAGPHDLSFLANPRYRNELATTRAAAVIIHPDEARAGTADALLADDPYLALARVASLFDDSRQCQPGVHPSAVVSPRAQVAADADIGAGCVIDPGAVVESGAILGPHCIIGPHCHVGADTHLVARVTLVKRVTLGARVVVHPGTVIGADGFGLASDNGRWVKIPQLGGVRIGDDCEIGANCTIDCGALSDTVLEQGVQLDNLIQIAHNVHIGAHTAIAGCAAVAGSAHIGRHCQIGGGAGILGHLTLADHVTITAMTLVTRSIGEAGEYSSGTAFQDNRAWRKNAARFRQLDNLARRVGALEKEYKT